MAVSIRTLQGFDRLAGPVAQVALQPLRLARRAPPERTRRILMVKFWGLGSITLLGPAARVLRERFPEAAVDLLTLESNALYARRLGAFDEVRSLSLGSGWGSAAAGIARMLGELRAQRYDRLYDFEFVTHFSALVARLSRARWTTGYSLPEVWRGGFFDEEVSFSRYWHVARNARSLAGGENGSEIAPGDLVRPAVTREGREEVERALADGAVRGGRPLVVVNPNAGQLALERRWPAEHTIAFLNGLLGLTEASGRAGIGEGALRVALVGAPDEREWVEGIRVRTLRPERIDGLAGRLSIDGLLALLERAELLVSNDSGPLHMAAALGRPVVALFGPETPVMYAPLSPRAAVLYRPPACSPCINVHDNKMVTCHLGHPLCLERIAPEEALAAVAASLHGARGPFAIAGDRR